VTDWLDRLRARGALLEGHFRLTSGLHSPVYVQCARLFQHPSDAAAAAADLSERLAPRVGRPPDLVISPAVGGIVLGHEMARAWGCRAIWAERDPASDRLVVRRGFAIEPGERAVAVEDVVTTAGSLRELVARVAESGAETVAVGAIVDRSGGEATWEVPWAALVRIDAPRYRPESCPQCARGLALERPGSRSA
jgi:orotate phosphoribosyltransferase